MSQQESVPVPRGWTGGAAWKGMGASVLLHLVVGAAVIAALSGPPKPAPRVIDLTLLPPAGLDRRPVPRILATTDPERIPGASVRPEPPAPPAPQAPANPPDVTAPTSASGPEAKPAVRGDGFPHDPSMPPGTTGPGPVTAAPGIAHGTPGAGTVHPAADFAWIRDAVQRAIAYPAAARRMGWEGKVVVAFHLLPDGSVRDVHIVQGSGHAALDRGAVDAVRNASPFPRSPIEAEVITPVVYRLTPR